MRRLSRLLIRAYPAGWRARYGDEFEALLAERGLSPFDAADILLGAIDAQLHVRGLGVALDHRKGFPMSLRLGGFAAMAGGLLWSVGFIVFAVFGEGWGAAGPILLVVSTAFLLVGLAGISAFQARRHPVLVWAGFAIPALGSVLTIGGLLLTALVGDQPVIGGFVPWEIWSLGLVAIFAGSGLFAIATWRTAALSRWAATVLGIGSAISSAVLLVGWSGLIEVAGLVSVGALGAFSLGWIVLGFDAVRRDQPATGSAIA